MSDRLSDLPDCVLLHIMKFMNAKDAVHTCVLSKRWKDLWKRLTVLTFDPSDFSSLPFFSQFVSSFLSYRDDSISLHNLDLRPQGRIHTQLLNEVMTYAASHDIQQLMSNVNLDMKEDFELPLSVFRCRTLTYLKLCFCFPSDQILLPKTLELPALKHLHLTYVTFATSDNGYAEPFSTCDMLNTLVIEDCYLQSDPKILYISNSKLLGLTIFSCGGFVETYEIRLTTPNLSLLTIEGDSIHKISSTCHITCPEEVNICLNCYGNFKFFVLISWLQVFANVKIMTLSRRAFTILNVLLSHGSIRTQLPCFVRLKSLKLKMGQYGNISDEKISRMVKYLLHNSPLTRVNIIKC